MKVHTYILKKLATLNLKTTLIFLQFNKDENAICY